MNTPITTNPLRVGLRQERVVGPQCLVIFGASGDLTHRKLIPALFDLYKQRRLPSEFAVLGCARRKWSDQYFQEKMAESMSERINISSGAPWESIAGYCRAVRVGQFIEVAGTTAVDAQGNFFGEGDVAAQTQ